MALSQAHQCIEPIQLGRWGFFLLAVPGSDELHTHVVGLNSQSGCCRVSSPIALFSAVAPFVAIRSGRGYDLVGPRGHSDECRAVIKRLAARWRARVVVDVTGWLFDMPSRTATFADARILPQTCGELRH